MKPVQYRNRRPLEYLPHDVRISLRTGRFYSREFHFRRKLRKLPGIVVGTGGIVLLIASELIQGSFGMGLFVVAALLIAVGGHFEIINRVHYPYRSLIAPAVVLMLVLINLIWPKTFTPLLPKPHVAELAYFSSGFPFSSTGLTVVFGGGERISFTYTKKQLEQAKNDSLSRSGSQIPFIAYVDGGKLYVNADIYAGADRPPIRIRGNVIYSLPHGWDGNYNSKAIEIVTADTVPVFQLVSLSQDSIGVKGVFQASGMLVIADESGVSTVKGKRVVFYSIRPIFKYPSWKFPHQRLHSP